MAKEFELVAEDQDNTISRPENLDVELWAAAGQAIEAWRSSDERGPFDLIEYLLDRGVPYRCIGATVEAFVWMRFPGNRAE